MKFRKILASAGLVAATAVAVPACSAISTPAVTGRATETGSTQLLTALSSWQVAYHEQNPHVLITTAGTGSGTGILDAATGLVDIGASDSYLPASVPATGLENIPLVVASLAVVDNLPGVHGTLHMDGAVLAGIYSGKITHWDDPAIKALNPGVKLPSYRIENEWRSDSSGSTDLFLSYLNAQDPAGWPATSVGSTIPASQAAQPGLRVAKGTSAVVSACQKARGCIAYIGSSYLPTATGLGVVALANGSKQYVLPTRAAMRQALATFAGKTPPTGTLDMINSKAGYPDINYEYAIVQVKQRSAALAAVIRNFLTWTITTGSSKSYLSAVNFVPLPVNVKAIAQALIAKVK